MIFYVRLLCTDMSLISFFTSVVCLLKWELHDAALTLFTCELKEENTFIAFCALNSCGWCIGHVNEYCLAIQDRMTGVGSIMHVCETTRIMQSEESWTHNSWCNYDTWWDLHSKRDIRPYVSLACGGMMCLRLMHSEGNGSHICTANTR